MNREDLKKIADEYSQIKYQSTDEYTIELIKDVIIAMRIANYAVVKMIEVD